MAAPRTCRGRRSVLPPSGCAWSLAASRASRASGRRPPTAPTTPRRRPMLDRNAAVPDRFGAGSKPEALPTHHSSLLTHHSVAGGAPLLDVRNLKKYFPIHVGLLRRHAGDVRAVDDVSFSIQERETLGLVGASGCGKTTAPRGPRPGIEQNIADVIC